MQVLQKNPKSLILANYNPAIRTSDKSLNDLLISISNHGILYPILVDKKMNVIDGHRRVACAIHLGKDKVPVFVSEANIDKDSAYETINTTARKMSKFEMIYIYVNGGKVPAKVERDIKELEKIIGRTALIKLGNKNISPAILSYASSVGRYVGDVSPAFMPKIIFWLINHTMVWTARRAMDGNISIAALKKAITSDKKLRAEWK